MPVLAGTVTAAIFDCRHCCPYISGGDYQEASALHAHAGHQGHLWRECRVEFFTHWGLDRNIVSVPIRGRRKGQTMKLQRTLMLLAILAIGGVMPAMAQVERVAGKTVRLECGLCAVFSEIYLRQIPYVDKIQISKSKEAVMMTYKPGGTFQPGE